MAEYYVLIIDSLRPQDKRDNFDIATALEATLDSIKIPRGYFKASSKELFKSVLIQALTDVVESEDVYKEKVIPILHFCMHGNSKGIGLADGSYIAWSELEAMLEPFKNLVGEPPILCFSTCKGKHAGGVEGLANTSYKILVGNTERLRMSSALVAFLTFYRGLYYAGKTLTELLGAMKAASFDKHFELERGMGYSDFEHFRSSRAKRKD